MLYEQKEVPMSKKLDSILKNIPPATSSIIEDKSVGKLRVPPREELTRIVARIPFSLKEEIRLYLQDKKGETESTLVLKALKSLGFKVEDSFLVDRRTIR